MIRNEENWFNPQLADIRITRVWFFVQRINWWSNPHTHTRVRSYQIVLYRSAGNNHHDDTKMVCNKHRLSGVKKKTWKLNISWMMKQKKAAHTHPLLSLSLSPLPPNGNRWKTKMKRISCHEYKLTIYHAHTHTHLFSERNITLKHRFNFSFAWRDFHHRVTFYWKISAVDETAFDVLKWRPPTHCHLL